MPRVFVPQEPMRRDSATGNFVPVYDLRPAEHYGSLVVCAPPNISLLYPEPVVTALRDALADFQQDDFLLAIGDPSLIAIAAGIVLHRHGAMTLLKWNRRRYSQDRAGAYMPVRVDLNSLLNERNRNG